MRVIRAIDLFAGAGGTSTGLQQACAAMGRKLDLTAINHWPVAVATHSANHPDARHLCESMENLDPRKVWPGGKRLDLLVASPECTHHSVARGGAPVNDQSRASAWHVVRWAEALRPRVILVENVPEFRTWGPLGCSGKRIARLKGETFLAWLRSLESLGYRVEHAILNAADFGEATTRRRLFVQARLAGTLGWPEPTHAADGRIGFCGAAKWRAARDVIDWTLTGKSIFGRRKPLSGKTLARIEAGIRKFWGSAAQPFLVVLRANADARSVREPIPALCASGQHVGVAHPFVLGQQSCASARAVGMPLPTVATDGAIGLVEPFLLPVTHAGGDRVRSVSEPTPTITTAQRGEQALIEPFVTEYYGNGGATAVADPRPTATTRDRFGLVESSGLDIRFRMLQPHELAAAMGFPADYKFAGNKSDAVKQIGNAVSVRTARAIFEEVLG